MTKTKLIATLALIPHREGGYFRRSFASDYAVTSEEGTRRPAMTSIYYLLTDDSPIGHWHRNRSDIMHYFHCGAPLHYWLIDPAGELSQHILGDDISAGGQLQLLVPGGYWKATELTAGAEYGLLSEAVSPGFCPQDMEMASADKLAAEYLGHQAIIRRLAKDSAAPGTGAKPG